MRYWLVMIVAISSSFAVGFFTGFFSGTRISKPYPVRALVDGRIEFTTLAKDVAEGRVPLRKDSQGYVLNDWLIDREVRYVRVRNNCVEFSFQSLPPDSTQKLIYSPQGYSGLPKFSVNDNGQGLVFFLSIDENWYYIRED